MQFPNAGIHHRLIKIGQNIKPIDYNRIAAVIVTTINGKCSAAAGILAIRFHNKPFLGFKVA